MGRKASAIIRLQGIALFFTLLVVYQTSHSFLLPNTNMILSRTTDQFSKTALSSIGDDADSVSDAEALLACWSYLKRRKRLGNWTKFERRKAMKASAKSHYFWEDEDDEVDIIIDDDDENEDYDTEDWNPSRDRNTDNTNNNPGTEKWFGEFTSFPIEPTATRRRRSLAAKRTWQDPEFRQRWQESRWGRKRSKGEEKERLLEKRIRALPPDFWGSPELARMTEKEIATAIDSYVSARIKRSASLKKTLQERKPALQKDKTESRLPRDALFILDHETLNEKQRLRSESATKAYRNRLRKKIEVSPAKRDHQRAFLPTRATPQDALLRIEDNLDQGVVPSVDDVQIIMKPLKLPKRKNLLKRLLWESFELQGKCVPADIGNCDGEKLFVTQCSVRHLGHFVAHLLKTREDGRLR